jgi:hypothetical protein
MSVQIFLVNGRCSHTSLALTYKQVRIAVTPRLFERANIQHVHFISKPLSGQVFSPYSVLLTISSFPTRD